MGGEAKVILDSISPKGDRLTTFEVSYHRFIMAELNTHRAFSRNSASSRAIPFDRVRTDISKDPAVPVYWPRKGPGMYVNHEVDLDSQGKAIKLWHIARIQATNVAAQMDALGVHKSVTNRLLEPFQFVTSIITSTTAGLENFFAQRDSEQAQPEMRDLAIRMRLAYQASKPLQVEYGQWHMPYLDQRDYVQFDDDYEHLRRISAARCARVSYLNHSGMRSWADDQKLYERLVTANPPHWSPLEHVARPYQAMRGKAEAEGNYDGWQQLRHLVIGGKA